MHQSPENETSPAAAPRPLQPRQDWISARFVEEGITIQLVYGTRSAAAFLKNRMIDLEVARRVLLNPLQRRSYEHG